uniref:WD_REPEATS_REGION domain-containing protein n=1 Tax=Syphacia muris TaxID=451379 RepID=A0A0N5ACF4_9BILA
EKVKEGGKSDSEDVEFAVKEVAAKAGKYLSTSKFLPEEKPLNAVRFHPSRPVLLTGGFNGVISLYEKAEKCEKGCGEERKKWWCGTDPYATKDISRTLAIQRPIIR